MSQQTLPRETSSASLGQVRPAEGGGDEEQGSSKSKEQRQQQLSSTSSSRGSQQQQAGGSSSSSSSGTGGGQQSSTAEFGDAAQYQELNPIGEGNVKLIFFVPRVCAKLTQ